MKRKIRHIMPSVSAVLVVFVAIFMVLPRDVCLAQFVTESCLCPASEQTDAQSCCCGNGKSVFSCGDHSNSDSDTAGSESQDTGSCFAITSSHSQLKSAERLQSVSITNAVVAVLPLPVEISAGPQLSVFTADHGVVPGRDEIHLHRENCVFII